MSSQGVSTQGKSYGFTLFYGSFSPDGSDLLTHQQLERVVTAQMAKALSDSTTSEGETQWDRPDIFHNIYLIVHKNARDEVLASLSYDVNGRPSLEHIEMCVTQLDLFGICTYFPAEQGVGCIELPVTRVRVQTACTFLTAVRKACALYQQDIPLQLHITDHLSGVPYQDSVRALSLYTNISTVALSQANTSGEASDGVTSAIRELEDLVKAERVDMGALKDIVSRLSTLRRSTLSTYT